MKNILNLELREKAGSDSYNRFEYQAHWILYHILDSFQKQKQFLVFCEFHDDMAESECNTSESMNFYQIKTSDTKDEWKLSNLFQKSKRKDGSYKNSFLGFIFYNFNKFSSECSSCHFISNSDFDSEVLEWQATIKDKKILKKENMALYYKIKNYLKQEYPTMPDKEFESTVDRFIQHTFFTKSLLTLEGHVEQVKGIFFEIVATRFNLDMKTGYLLLTNIIDSVRKKTRTIIKTPISYEELKERKGISSDIFKDLEIKFSAISKCDKQLSVIEEYLKNNGLSSIKVKAILNSLKKHQSKLLDVSDGLYQDIIKEFNKEVDDLVETNFELIDNFQVQYSLLENLIHAFLQKHSHQGINNVVLKGVFYEALL